MKKKTLDRKKTFILSTNTYNLNPNKNYYKYFLVHACTFNHSNFHTLGIQISLGINLITGKHIYMTIIEFKNYKLNLTK